MELIRARWIIVDLDGTLCDCSHRVHWAQAKQWQQFHAGIHDDKLRPDVHKAIELLAIEHHMLLCTGRDEQYRKATEEWLRANKVSIFFDDLLMRPDNNRDRDHELKPKMVASYFGSIEKARQEVLFVLDDRDKVVEAWRDNGFNCWQVSAGQY